MGTEREPPHRVTARDVLKALSEVRRRKQWTLFQELEATDPDLAEFVFEEISILHHTLLQAGVRPIATRRLQQKVQRLVLVCILAPRNVVAHDNDYPTPPPHQENPHEP